MASLLVVIFVAAICVLSVRANRLHRQRWLERLDLPGTWVWEDHDGMLTLDGALDHGHYRIRDGDREERGEWQLRGHDLILQPSSGGAATALDLRLFSDGKIGVHGPGREHRIYVKRRSNVVPLRRPA